MGKTHMHDTVFSIDSKMATRSGDRRREPPVIEDGHDEEYAAQIERLSGWTAEELDGLLQDYSVPDHWSGIPCVALMESIRKRIDESPKTYLELFPPVLTALNLRVPKFPGVGLVKKIKRRVEKAKKDGILILSEELPGLSMKGSDTSEIGPNCTKHSIWTTSLLEGASCEAKAVTNAVIIELYRYRERMNIPWHVVKDVWWPNIFHSDQCPPAGTIQSSWKSINTKRQQLRKAQVTEFLDMPYNVPTPKPCRPTPSDEESDTDDDSDLEFYPDSISNETFNHMADCMEYLTDLWHDETLEHAQTSKDHGRVEKALQQALDINRDLKKQVSTLQRKNVVRRLQRRDEELEEQKKENQRLNKKIEQLEKNIKSLQADKKRKGDSRNYFIKSAEKCKRAHKELQKHVKVLEIKNDDLKCRLDHIMEDREIVSFEQGKYSNDIRLVCFELLARGVGINHVSDIIRLVLKDVAKMDVGRLPKPTLIRYLAVEQSLLSKECARAQIQNTDDPVTLHTDGTTKKRKGYVTTLATTSDGTTVGMSLHDIESETADALLEDTKETLEELVRLDVKSAPTETVHQIIAKVKNTMTDRCIVNKLYISKLEKWRASVLPQVTENFDTLDEEVKQELSTMNDLYCGKHLVLNLQEYASAAIKEWERVESNEGKIGREKKTIWNRSKGESATLLTVRTFCNLLGPDCDEQSGLVEEFKTIAPTSHLAAYRGNRFNIPFQNSAAVYYHRDHFDQLCSHLDPQREENMYIKCLKADFEDDIVIAGIRAMGMINQHISTPLMKMVESDLHIIDTDKYYTRLHDKVQQWMIDPSPIVNDSACLFPDIPPVRDDVHKSLYSPTTENIEHLTKQALSIIFHNFMVCITRQLSDHLPGGRFHNANEEIRRQTTSCPKDNLAAERVFAGLDYLKRKMPNANTVAVEGILLWSLNKTRDYLDGMDEEQRNEYLRNARQQRSAFLQLYQRKCRSIKEKLAQKLQRNKDKKEEKRRALTKQAAENTAAAVKLCGVVCTSVDDVEALKVKMKDSGKKYEQALTAQLKQWKTASKGGVRKDLFYLTKKGVKLTAEELEENLKEIITGVMTESTSTSDSEAASGSTSNQSTEEKEKQRKELKEKLLSKVSPSKKRRRGPFPGDRILQKRIRHTFVDSVDGKLLECKGTVLRRASEEDIEELVERGDRKLVGQYTFYTIMYDAPYEELLCYPLEKEWDEDLLELM